MEILDIYDDNDKLTGKTVVRYSRKLEKGEHVKASHIIIRNKKGEYLIQKRSSAKRTRPSTWDITCGAVSSGETSRVGAMREVSEEVGLNANENNFVFIGQVMSDTGVFQDIFFLEKDFDLNDCTMQKEEVDELKLIDKTEMLKFIDTLTHRNDAYRNIIKEFISKN